MLPTYQEALASALSVVTPRSTTELLPLSEVCNRILADNVVADRDFPPFNRSQMDGYAVHAREVEEGVIMQVIGQVPAGSIYNGDAGPLTSVTIATGAPLPECFDAVVPHEKTDSGVDQVVFHCNGAAPGDCVHLQGADAKEGDVVIETHTLISPQHIGICASAGVHEVPVLSKPRVIIITSGDEVVAVDAEPQSYQIRNGNNPMISQAFRAMGCEIVAQHHLQDDPVQTGRCIAESLDGRADLVVTVGGISAGKRDFFPEALSKSGVELAVKGAKIQPGKPVIVGKHASAVVVGLPGNPVSALSCCCIFGWPIVRALFGMSTQLPWQIAPLAQDVKPNPNRRSFRPCILVDGKITLPSWQGSGDLSHTSATNGLVQLPELDGVLEQGTAVACLAFPWV